MENKIRIINNKDISLVSYPVGSDISLAEKAAKGWVRSLSLIYGTDVQGINIWFRGSSGAILSALLASHLLHKGIFAKLSHVKKQGEKTHNPLPIFEDNHLDIIVDDFIVSGATVNAIIEEMQKRNRKIAWLLLTNKFSYSDMENAVAHYPNIKQVDNVISGSYGYAEKDKDNVYDYMS